jgi:hypothetical protein
MQNCWRLTNWADRLRGGTLMIFKTIVMRTRAEPRRRVSCVSPATVS